MTGGEPEGDILWMLDNEYRPNADEPTVLSKDRKGLEQDFSVVATEDMEGKTLKCR